MRRGAGGAYFDLLAAHPYGFGRPPDDPPAADRLSFRRLEPYRAVMEAHGDGNKAVWITEMGWRNQAVAPEDAWQAVSPEQQAEYVARALACVADELPWLERMALWELNAGVDVYGYALWQGPGQATPACDDLVERCRGQVGCPVPVARKSDPSAEVEILAADVIIRLGDISTLHPQWVHLPSLPGAVDDASGSRDQFVARIYVGQGGELVVGHLNRL